MLCKVLLTCWFSPGEIFCKVFGFICYSDVLFICFFHMTIIVVIFPDVFVLDFKLVTFSKTVFFIWNENFIICFDMRSCFTNSVLIWRDSMVLSCISLLIFWGILPGNIKKNPFYFIVTKFPSQHNFLLHKTVLKAKSLIYKELG